MCEEMVTAVSTSWMGPSQPLQLRIKVTYRSITNHTPTIVTLTWFWVLEHYVDDAFSLDAALVQRLIVIELLTVVDQSLLVHGYFYLVRDLLLHISYRVRTRHLQGYAISECLYEYLHRFAHDIVDLQILVPTNRRGQSD